MTKKGHLYIVKPSLPDKAAEDAKPRNDGSGRYLKYVILGSAMLAAGMGITLGVSYALSYDRPKEIYITEDLDYNEIADLIIVQHDGYKVPFYGKERNGEIIYLSGAEMEKNPNNIINYDAIEERLNRKH